jgi:DNA mismatch repair protein MSH6
MSESESGEQSRFGLCVLDCSTSEFNLAAFEDDICRTRLETALRQLRVKELLFMKVHWEARQYGSSLTHIIRATSR